LSLISVPMAGHGAQWPDMVPGQRQTLSRLLRRRRCDTLRAVSDESISTTITLADGRRVTIYARPMRRGEPLWVHFVARSRGHACAMERPEFPCYFHALDGEFACDDCARLKGPLID
jgi:hypothetical protein